MAADARVLVVDDDVTVRDVVRRYLEASGYAVEVVGDGAAGLRAFARNRADLVVLDVMMPGINGLEVCRRLRRESEVPVVLLTALGEEENRIAGLRLGADDYVTKPFSPRELALRVDSILRRTRPRRLDPVSAEVRDAGLVLDTAARHAELDGVELPLTVREFDLLAFLLAHPGVVFSRSELLGKVWGWDFGDHSTVTVHVRRLREKVERDPANPVRIATVWGIGYRYDRGG
ncbi:response regulator transcription factor [Saccharopolyspora sp. MS10]|uniref:response regulator transcription factor n=1 Tax=Saccharopolyspora sp. MS10 TaxID=3385973 RepID=UPI00399F351B